jgi:hypothetical protein
MTLLDTVTAFYPSTVSRQRPCGDGALWQIWAAGASHAGLSRLIFLGTFRSMRMSQWGYWPPIFVFTMRSEVLQ